MSSTMKQDATEFGVHVKQGGWRLGLLVARNVEKGTHRDGPVSLATGSGKVSASFFARESGTSADRVLRYLASWNQAAEAGIVPASVDLEPGAEIDLDVDELEDWGQFYSVNVQVQNVIRLLRKAAKHLKAARDEITHARLTQEQRDLLREELQGAMHKAELLRAAIEATAKRDWDSEVVNLIDGEAS